MILKKAITIAKGTLSEREVEVELPLYSEPVSFKSDAKLILWFWEPETIEASRIFRFKFFTQGGTAKNIGEWIYFGSIWLNKKYWFTYYLPEIED